MITKIQLSVEDLKAAAKMYVHATTGMSVSEVELHPLPPGPPTDLNFLAATVTGEPAPKPYEPLFPVPGRG